MDWDKYDEQFFINPNNIISQANECFLNIINNLNLKGKKYLDFGCGSGYWIKFLLEKGADVTGVDVSSKAVKRCKSLYPSCLFRLQKNNGTISFSDSLFDIVTVSYVFQEIHDNTVFKTVISEIARILSSSGKLVVVGNIYPDKRVLYESTVYGDLFINNGVPSLYRFFRGDTMSVVLKDYFKRQNSSLRGYSFFEIFKKV